MRRGVVALLIVAIAAVGGFGAWHATRPEPEPKFCTTGLALATVEGRSVALEDQGDPGRDRCDLGESELRREGVLGFDCTIRDGEGRTVGTTTPNRDDGTCGQDDR